MSSYKGDEDKLFFMVKKLNNKKKNYDVKIITMKWDKWDLSSTLNGTFLSCHITKIKITVHVLLLI